MVGRRRLSGAGGRGVGDDGPATGATPAALGIDLGDRPPARPAHHRLVVLAARPHRQTPGNVTRAGPVSPGETGPFTPMSTGTMRAKVLII